MTTKEKIEIMQAHVDGKVIQFKKDGESRWIDLNKKSSPIWDWAEYDYRIKPEPKEPTYRPYKDFAEFRKDWEKHGGWMLNKNTDEYVQVLSFCENACESLCKNYTWADDGSPCGVLVEEGGDV